LATALLGGKNIDAVDASSTREELRQLLQRHPSEVADVLALSPSLISNETYMASYPALRAYVQAHPEVAANPVYFFGGYGYNRDERSATMRFWEDFLAVLAAILSGVFASLLVAWLIKTLLEQRRWNALQRVQAEVHQKMLDRLGWNEQLLAYPRPPGRPPLPGVGPHPGRAPPGEPPSAVLWSMQVGLRPSSPGSASAAAPRSGAEALCGDGDRQIFHRHGFVVSSVASFLLSRRLGLLGQPARAPGTGDVS
jgi:hypothetical protein